MIRLTTTTKVMAAGLMMSLGWIVLAACNCDDDDDDVSGFWVECQGNQPVLMNVIFGDITSVAEPYFNPDDWNCSHTGSPHYKGSEAAALAELVILGSQRIRPAATCSGESGGGLSSASTARIALHPERHSSGQAAGVRCYLPGHSPDGSHQCISDPHFHLPVSAQDHHSGGHSTAAGGGHSRRLNRAGHKLRQRSEFHRSKHQ